MYGPFHLEVLLAKVPNGTSCFFVLFSCSQVSLMQEKLSDKFWLAHSLASIPMLEKLRKKILECLKKVDLSLIGIAKPQRLINFGVRNERGNEFFHPQGFWVKNLQPQRTPKIQGRF